MKGKSYYFWKCPTCDVKKRTRNTKKRPLCTTKECKGAELILKV